MRRFEEPESVAEWVVSVRPPEPCQRQLNPDPLSARNPHSELANDLTEGPDPGRDDFTRSVKSRQDDSARRDPGSAPPKEGTSSKGSCSRNRSVQVRADRSRSTSSAATGPSSVSRSTTVVANSPAG
jgi:hypothetical protein